MPIGTSDGDYFETHYDMLVAPNVYVDQAFKDVQDAFSSGAMDASGSNYHPSFYAETGIVGTGKGDSLFATTPVQVKTASITGPTSNTQQSVFDQTLEEYPRLKGLGLTSKQSPASGSNMLEFWPAGEPGTTDRPRPKEFDINKPGVELYGNKATSLDVLGDIVSHHMVGTDPVIKKYYSDFQKSLTPEQNDRLKSQYEWAQKNEGETRPFEDWKTATGLPAYFRGYAFKQWPQEFNDTAYTPEQRASFDEMMKYLKSEPNPETVSVHKNWYDKTVGFLESMRNPPMGVDKEGKFVWQGMVYDLLEGINTLPTGGAKTPSVLKGGRQKIAIDFDRLRDMYVNQEMSATDIAKELKISQKPVLRALKEAGIETRPSRQEGVDPELVNAIKTGLDNDKTYAQIAEEHGITRDAVAGLVARYFGSSGRGSPNPTGRRGGSAEEVKQAQTQQRGVPSLPKLKFMEGPGPEGAGAVAAIGAGLAAAPTDSKAAESNNSSLTSVEKTFLKVLDTYEKTGLASTRVRLYNDIVQRGRTEPITEKDLSSDELRQLKELVRFKAERSGKSSGKVDYKDYQDYTASRSYKDQWNNPTLTTDILGGFKYSIKNGKITVEDTYDFNTGGKFTEHDNNSLLQALAFVADPYHLAAAIGRKVVPNKKGKGIPVNISLDDE